MAAQAQRAAAAVTVKNRGRPQNVTKVTPIVNNVRSNQQNMRPQVNSTISLPNNFQMTNAGQYIQVNVRPIHVKSEILCFPISNKNLFFLIE